MRFNIQFFVYYPFNIRHTPDRARHDEREPAKRMYHARIATF
ncbi:MAG: hypothetical protein Q6373_008730 [Candidatus Sigynarchaeota archaeon]